MAFYPVLWNHFDGDDFDGMFDFIKPLGFVRPVRSAKRLRHESKSTDRKWTYSLQIGDFRPENVKVRVENGKVLVYAKNTEGDNEWGDIIERRRVVHIPDDVDADKIHSHMRTDGSLVLEAPLKKPPENQLAVVDRKGWVVVPSEGQNNLMKIPIANYKPEEIKVTYKDGILTAQGERQRSDDGLEIRETFFRQMTVPNTVDEKSIQCVRDEEGNLTIQAPTKADVEKQG